jgi:hypothetical protein
VNGAGAKLRVIRIYAVMSRPNSGYLADSTGKLLMKAFIAALIAVAILYLIDSQYNDGRYTEVLHQAVTNLLAG